MIDNGNVSLTITNCLFFHGHAFHHQDTIGIGSTGGMYFFVDHTRVEITIQNTDLVENESFDSSEIYFQSFNSHDSSLSILNSTITHTETTSRYGVSIKGCCTRVIFNNTRMRLTKQIESGMFVAGHFQGFGPSAYWQSLRMDNCIIERSQSVTAILHMSSIPYFINNCTFSNNSGSQSVIMIQNDDSFSKCPWKRRYEDCSIISNCLISDNNMTGIVMLKNTQLKGLVFSGRNVIQNNRNTEGAGIVLMDNAFITVSGELLLYNNTAEIYGGGILVMYPLFKSQMPNFHCTVNLHGASSSVIFSGNRAGQGGSDMYRAILMDCYNILVWDYISHVGHPNETSWYFDTPLKKHIHFSNTDRLSSMSSDPIMVCFCNTTTNLPDCSDRIHHKQTYPGLEINTSIATVGYYGGTSPGVVQVTAQQGIQVRYYGQKETTECFQLHILLQNRSSTTALIDIRVDGGLQDWGVSIGVDILECPIGFTEIKGQCQCEQFLDTSHVQCNISATPFNFMRSGNSWFSYINNVQCLTGTTNCPFDYCNRSNVSFDIMAPDRQCVANRSGILCGQCQSHLSVKLGSTHCGTCSNWYIFLLPVLAIAGIVLVAVLMILNLSVSVGTINGLLFYANMVKLN